MYQVRPVSVPFNREERENQNKQNRKSKAALRNKKRRGDGPLRGQAVQIHADREDPLMSRVKRLVAELAPL